MADTSTKAVAARLPLDDYVKIIRAAAELKLSVSEYLIMKLHSSDSTREAEERLEKVTAELARTKKELSEVQVKLEGLQRRPIELVNERRKETKSKPVEVKNPIPVVDEYWSKISDEPASGVRRFLHAYKMRDESSKILALGLNEECEWNDSTDWGTGTYKAVRTQKDNYSILLQSVKK